MKAWLADNPIEIVFEALEPTFEPFTDQTPFYNLKSYDGTTHVSIVGCHEELNPITTIRFPRNEDGAMVLESWALSKTGTRGSNFHQLTDDEIEAIWNEVFN